MGLRVVHAHAREAVPVIQDEQGARKPHVFAPRGVIPLCYDIAVPLALEKASGAGDGYICLPANMLLVNALSPGGL